jgi:topoisomerase-4 subunit A
VLFRSAEDILLSEIERGTVDFRENYDGTLKEPALLPARLPVLLLNGVSGIAVGMATEMAPHNLREVVEACVSAIGGCDDETIYGAIPGPDFPGGAQIISSPEDIRKAYETGRGSIRVRARWTVEPLARGQYRIAITQLPPNTSTAKVLSEIEDLINPKLKTGKKSLTPEQQTLKGAVLAVLDTFRDDSDAAHPVRILLEPKTRTVDADDLMNVLLANTSLEGNFAINMTMIGRDGKPQQKRLPQVVREWCDFRLVVVERRLRHRFNEVERRLHILEGRMIAFLRIEEVIKVIRESDDPKKDLMAHFDLSEIQAEDILEIRLRQLARLEGFRIEKELKELKKERDGLKRLLGSESARRELAISEIRKDAEKYGDDRRSLMEASEKVTAGRMEAVADEAVTVILSRNGFIRCRIGHGVDKAALTWKDGDGELAVLETRSIWPVVLLDATGRSYSLRTAELPGGKGDGVPVTSLLDLSGSKVSAMLCAPPESRVLLASSTGVGFIAKVSDMVARVRAGKAFMSLDEGAELLPPTLVPPDAKYIAALSAASFGTGPRLLVFPIEEIKELAGGKGVILLALADGERLAAARAVGVNFTVFGRTRGGKDAEQVVSAKDIPLYLHRRARRGQPLSKLKTGSGIRG